MLLSSTLVATALLFFGCSDEPAESDKLIATTSFDLTADDATVLHVTKEVDHFALDGSAGKVVIYDIFATWCPPCQAAASHLTSLQNKYPDQLKIIGLSIEDDIDTSALKVFREENDARYTIAFGEAAVLLSRSIASSIRVGQQFPIPLMVMFKDGKYITHYTGLIPEEMIESDIKQALGNQ